MALPSRVMNVRGLMMVIATIAVACSMFVGLGELSIYRPNTEGERFYWQASIDSEATGDISAAADWRRRAEEIRKRNRESLPSILTSLMIIGAGVISLVVGLTVRERYGRIEEGRPAFIHSLTVACSNIARIIFLGLGIGASVLIIV